MRPLTYLIAAALLLPLLNCFAESRPFAIAPTGQRSCYDTRGTIVACAGSGQDASFATTPLRYRDNADGTVTDLITGLMWQKQLGTKLTWRDAGHGAGTLTLGGHSDWRLPTIKELYSLMDFSGNSPMPGRSGKPYIDGVFEFRYGDTAAGERPIDAQFWSATEYVGLTMERIPTAFGVNFADGRIKGYPKALPGRGEHRMFVRYVRGNPDYGRNNFRDNKNGTVTDLATGLMWLQADSAELKAGPKADGQLDWPQALAWAAQMKLAGYGDWRLPNAKELQSIVDYGRSPQTNGKAAIDPIFRSSLIGVEGGRQGYGFYWTSTSHLDGPRPGSDAIYIAFGEALGFMRSPWTNNQARLMDVHGAGAQRGDPKQGNPADHPMGMGPQGDVRRIYNLVRLVRNTDGSKSSGSEK